MILTLHRRYPDGEHWEIDPEPMGTLFIEPGNIQLEMEESSIKSQIKKVLSRPITYIAGFSGDESESSVFKIVEKDSEDYIDALIFELRKIGIESRRRYHAVV